jgi:hypothetical protein
VTEQIGIPGSRILGLPQGDERTTVKIQVETITDQ